MGSTGVCALVTPADAAVAWVGDSRGYLMEGAALRQVTKDHSLVQRLIEIGQITAEEAHTHEHKNVITRSLGARQSGPAGAEAVALKLKRGDKLMLCSDGLTAHVDGPSDPRHPGAQRGSLRRGARIDRRGQRRRRYRQHFSDRSLCELGANAAPAINRWPPRPKTRRSRNTGPLEPGTVLQGRYQIQRLLGGGGMGMVYLAHDQRLANRPCAIKEMVDHFIDQAQRIEANEYFAREADTLAQLKHQAIPAITDRFELANRHYLVMEYVEGRNLEEELAARGEPLPEGLVIDIARQLCDVLVYLHGLVPPIIYRDMKPSNVMLNSNGRVVLVDFGIARLFKAARKGTMIGTLGFAPPEQYQGMVDPRSDIYSLGATLHYVLTGRDPEKFPPFSFPPVRELRPAVSSNLAGAIDAALAYEMDGRPGRVQEFRDMMLYGRGLSLDSGARELDQRNRRSVAVPGATRVRTTSRSLIASRAAGCSRSIGLAIFLMVLAGAAFGGTYLYSSPELQQRLGLKPLFDGLPWKHEELLAKARENPLEFSHDDAGALDARGHRAGGAASAVQRHRSDQRALSEMDRDLQEPARGAGRARRKSRGALLRSQRASDRVERHQYLCRARAENRRLQRRGADADDDRQAARHLQSRALLGRQDARRRKASSSIRT